MSEERGADAGPQEAEPVSGGTRQQPVWTRPPTTILPNAASEPPATSALPGLTTAQYDAHILRSGISFDVAREYGIRGVASEELLRLGFSSEQARDGLLLPLYWDSAVEPRRYQLRPWVPRIASDGKPIRYETPANYTAILATHPNMVRRVADPGVPLVITEGVKKLLAWETKQRRLREDDHLRLGDAKLARPAVISLTGVYGWMGGNLLGGRGIPHADLIELPFRGEDEVRRTVILAFDSDVMTKPQVHGALRELRDYLLSRGADVWVMYLPPAEEVGKVGLDDFLAAPHSLQDALNCCEAKLRPLADAPTLLTFADVLALPPVPWTLKGLLPAEGVTILYGPFASFKSFVLLDWLTCVAADVPDWFAAPIERHGPCVYIYSEGRAGMGQRAQSVRLARRLPDNTPLYVLPNAVDVTSPRAVASLIDLVRTTLHGRAPVIVAIDTVSRNMPGKDANAPVDMNAFVAGCDAIRRAFECQVIAVHHPTKGKGDPRGALDLSNSADTIIKLERIKDDLATTLTVEKQKDADHGVPSVVRLRPEADSLTLTAVEPRAPAGTARTPPPKLPEKRHLTLRALAFAPPDGLSFGDWERAAAATGVQRSTFRSARQLLLDEGKVSAADGRYQLAAAGVEYAKVNDWNLPF